MNLWLSLAWYSAWSRRFALVLVTVSVSVSVLILLGVQQLREDAKRSFSNAVSGVDLIVGPRGSATELMLYSVFQIGRPSKNMGIRGYEEIKLMPQVRWVIPIQLGDTYKGYPVLGTSDTLFTEFKSQGRGLEWAHGRAFGNPLTDKESVHEVVLGAEVAQHFNHRIDDRIVLTHGADGGPEDTDHDDHPLVVVGILKPTGAPIDRSVLVNLEGFESMHQGWGMGILPKALKSAAAALPDTTSVTDLQPANLSAVWVGLHHRSEVFSVKRKIESLSRDPLMAVLPGVALDELWQVVKIVENSLVVIGMMVSVSAMLSVAAVLLVAMSGRRKELAILRAMGASPRALMGFVLIESVMVCLIGIALGYAVTQFLILVAQDMLRTQFGVMVQPGLPGLQALASLGLLFCISMLASLLPAWRAYSLSLMDGLHPPSV